MRIHLCCVRLSGFSFGTRRNPFHEDLISERQRRGAYKHSENSTGGYTAERAEKDYRHRDVNAAAQHYRLQDVVGHTRHQQNDRVRDVATTNDAMNSSITPPTLATLESAWRARSPIFGCMVLTTPGRSV